MNKIFEKIFKGYAILEEVNSPINGKIQVLEDIFGKKRLVVGGLSQSGEPVEKIWLPAIKQLSHARGRSAAADNLAIKQCLILGLGAGSVVQLIKVRWPKAKIVGIEIDPEIIRLGKKYFGLGEIKKLKIITANAFEWVTACLNDSNHFNKDFDLILIDLYIGNKLPEEVKSEKFLRNTKKLLSKKGVAILNWLKNKNEREFIKRLERIFSRVDKVDTPTNLFLSVR